MRLVPTGDSLLHLEDRFGIRTWWPLGVALILATGAVLFLPRVLSSSEREIHAPRPIALAVDAREAEWRVTWNPEATAIQRARSARLYVVQGSDRAIVALNSANLARGEYRHRSLQNEATFRLEVDEISGHVSAESFRLMRSR